MIQLVDGTSPKVRLTPRNGFKTKSKIQELDLIYGHRCPVCNNVIQAFFYTPQRIELWPYEETTVLSQGEKNMGEILKIFPDNKASYLESCYKSYFYPVNSGKSAQKIVLKNHLMRLGTLDQATFDRTKLWEVGERTCPWTGVFSMREDIAIKDVGLILKMTHDEFERYNIPKISELIPDAAGMPTAPMYRWTPAVGNAPPVLMLTREVATQGHPFDFIKELLVKFRKPAVSKENT